MANSQVRDEAINIAFELTKLAINKYVGRQLDKAEEQELIDELRELEAQRHFKTPDELLGSDGDVS